MRAQSSKSLVIIFCRQCFASVHIRTFFVSLLCMILLKGNHTNFLVQFGNLHASVFQNVQIAFALRAHEILLTFYEKPLVQTHSKLNSKSCFNLY